MLVAEIREAQAVDVPGDNETGDPARVVGVLAVRIHGELEQVRPIIAAMMFAPMTAELSEDGALVLRLKETEESVPAAPRRGPTRRAKPASKKKASPRTSAVRRAAGTKPVACPVQDCGIPGIRSKMNFCAEHAGTLPKTERQRLRQAQRANHAGQDATASEETA